jgi:predicted phosphohydrolase
VGGYEVSKPGGDEHGKQYTHGLHRQIVVPHGDVLIIAGDLTRHGELDELPDLNDWLGTLPHAHKLLIAGNHDFICEQQPERIPQLLSNATYLCDTTIEIAGVVCFGSPWTPGGGGWAFSRSLNALAYRWAEIPATTDVLITHGPPLGTLDQNARGEHLGCPALAEAVRRVRPRLHVFGHIHEAYGMSEADGISSVNASSCTVTYAPIHVPLVIELP